MKLPVTRAGVINTTRYTKQLEAEAMSKWSEAYRVYPLPWLAMSAYADGPQASARNEGDAGQAGSGGRSPSASEGPGEHPLLAPDRSEVTTLHAVDAAADRATRSCGRCGREVCDCYDKDM